MADTIKIGNLDISSFKVGSADCSIYLGDVKLYPQINLPYDAEIEYLESTGTQWIDTGVLSNTIKFNLKTSLTNNSVTQTLLGTVKYGGDNNSVEYQIGSIASGIYIVNTQADITSYVPIKNTIYIVEGEFNKTSTVDWKLNNTIVATATKTATTQLANLKPWILLARGTITNLFPAYAKIYSAKLWISNDTLVRDFIPVRIGTTGYLYDKVSGRLFGNAGTGDFVLGNDI